MPMVSCTMAACSGLGATRGLLLDYSTSAEAMRSTYGLPADDVVGYAAVVFA